eukprot:jgi/Chrzof1/7622/Cz02g30170.t1
MHEVLLRHAPATWGMPSMPRGPTSVSAGQVHSSALNRNIRPTRSYYIAPVNSSNAVTTVELPLTGTPPLLSVQVPVQVSVPQDKANETVRDDLLELLQVVLDLGRRPEARFRGGKAEYLRSAEVNRADLEAASAAVGVFGADNRAGIPGTLHRISAIRNRKGTVVGLTCRVGRAVSGHVDLIQDILEEPKSTLFLGRPGVGKTTGIREIARVLSDVMRKRVVIVDTSNEIGGDGDVPHPAIGGARRMQVPDAARQHHVMIEAVENHMPEVVIVDEIGTEAEALACRTIAERGVTLIGTAHGLFLENLIKNPTLSDLVGGVQSVTLGDEEANRRGTQKSILERRGPPTFPIVIEMRERMMWVAHDTQASVDALLLNKVPLVQLRSRDPDTKEASMSEYKYDQVDDKLAAELAKQGALSAAAVAAAAATGLSADLYSGPLSLQDYVTLTQGTDSDNNSSSSSTTDSSTNDSSSSSGMTQQAAGMSPADVEAGVWAERVKGMSEKEALQELAMLRYLGGQVTGILRPRNHGAFSYGSASSSSSSSSRKKKRATKANAKQR